MDRDWFEYEYVELKSFQRQIKKLCSSDEEEAEIKNFVSKNRRKGDPIIGKSGIRKLRVPLGDRGTRGGARVIYYFSDNTEAFILFLMIYSKSDQEDLSPDQEKLLIRAKEQELKEKNL